MSLLRTNESQSEFVNTLKVSSWQHCSRESSAFRICSQCVGGYDVVWRLLLKDDNLMACISEPLRLHCCLSEFIDYCIAELWAKLLHGWRFAGVHRGCFTPLYDFILEFGTPIWFPNFSLLRQILGAGTRDSWQQRQFSCLQTFLAKLVGLMLLFWAVKIVFQSQRLVGQVSRWKWSLLI